MYDTSIIRYARSRRFLRRPDVPSSLLKGQALLSLIYLSAHLEVCSSTVILMAAIRASSVLVLAEIRKLIQG